MCIVHYIDLRLFVTACRNKTGFSLLFLALFSFEAMIFFFQFFSHLFLLFKPTEKPKRNLLLQGLAAEEDGGRAVGIHLDAGANSVELCSFLEKSKYEEMVGCLELVWLQSLQWLGLGGLRG